MRSRVRRLLGRFLITVLVGNSLAAFSPILMTVHAQNRVIVVNAEQPNVWTLEQAHYLLAQMHRRNLDLKAKSLDELDPNEIAGLRFDVMRTLIEFGATFNQADLASNRLLSANQTFNSERRQKLIDDRTRLSDESVRLSGQIKDLEIEKADTEDADQKKRLDAKIAALTMNQTKVDKQVESIDAELKTLNAPSGTPTATTGGATFDASKLPKSVFDKAFEDAAAKQIGKFNEEPRLNATLRLDNFLQMQYEIISKQLSLLRDELGPGERLVFLELPQTVNVAHHEADQKWAQSWWKIAGYTRRAPDGSAPAAPAPTPFPIDPHYEPITTTQDFNSILNGDSIPLPVACNPGIPTTITNSNIIMAGDMTSPAGKVDSSSVKVSASGRVTNVTVTLNGLRHSLPQNVNIMLAGPQGQNALIVSDVGGSTPVSDLTITLDDTAPYALGYAGSLTNGTFRPTNFDTTNDSLPKSVPQPLGGSALSVFKGTDPKGTWNLYAVDSTGRSAGSLSGGWSLSIMTDCAQERPKPMEVRYKDIFVNLDEFDNQADGLSPNSVLKGRLTNAKFENRMVRTVDLIPRQSSLNVNDMKLRTRAGAFNFVLSTLFGFGSRLNVERQREQFSQFVQQELYSSAFGKGAREFGWTFTPMPGTDRLQSGVRTTYAVVVVPDDATSLVLESNGCYFPRSYYPPNDFDDTKDSRWNNDNRTSRNCSGTQTKAFVVPIPSARVNGGNEFWVDRIAFEPVPKGKRVVVEVGGKNFSPQTGILINGVPLVQSIGLAQPLIRDDSAVGRATTAELKDVEIPGQIERIDSEKIVFSFRMPSDFKGTPTITLIAPGRATDINRLPHMEINYDGHDTTLDAYPKKMFGNERAPDDFRIDNVRVFRSRTSNTLTAVISGAGFVKDTKTPSLTSDAVGQVLVNGSDVGLSVSFKSPALMTVDFPLTADETIKVTLVSEDKNPKKVETIESDAVANPARLSVSDVEVITYEAAAEKEPATLVVKITGTGFTDKLKASVGEIAVKSATEAILTLTDPKAASIVTLEDTDTHQQIKVVVTRKQPPK